MLNIRFRERTNTWPGFVDLFSNLVIILIFLLIVFVFLWTTTSVFNKHSGTKVVAQLKQVNAEQLVKLDNLEQDNAKLNSELEELDTSVKDLVTAYEGRVNELTTQLAQANADKEMAMKLEQERRELQEQMQESSRQMAERSEAQKAEFDAEIARLQAALDAAEEKSTAQQAEYVEMSTRLNRALADKVAELNKVQSYQSDFYRAVKDAVGDRTTVQPDGDRFIVSSDILFGSGSYTLSPEGKNQLRLIANVIKDFETKIPSDVDWIIRVDGHTDKKAVVPGTRAYRDNMELSLRRATAVVDALAAAGVSRRRLVPSGFGDLHPVEMGNSQEILQKNRRIELQLTNK